MYGCETDLGHNTQTAGVKRVKLAVDRLKSIPLRTAESLTNMLIHSYIVCDEQSEQHKS